MSLGRGWGLGLGWGEAFNLRLRLHGVERHLCGGLVGEKLIEHCLDGWFLFCVFAVLGYTLYHLYILYFQIFCRMYSCRGRG